MPEISRFFGIVVAMYYAEHEPVPHFHVRYGSQKARIAIDDLRVLDGNLSPRVRGLVAEWASLHQDELRKDWELARSRLPLISIKPLD